MWLRLSSGFNSVTLAATQAGISSLPGTRPAKTSGSSRSSDSNFSFTNKRLKMDKKRLCFPFSFSRLITAEASMVGVKC